MRATPSRLEGPVVFEPVVYGDERGFFLESFRQSALVDAGVDLPWVQDNHSRSRRGIVRGMHYQPGMAKLVRCVRGEVLDVLVDVRRGSPTFAQWAAFPLDDVTHHVLYVPEGFAHGFAVVSELADLSYKCSTYYDPDTEGGIAFDDPDLAITWPEGLELTPSARDAAAPRLRDVADALPFAFA